VSDCGIVRTISASMIAIFHLSLRGPACADAGP
jgi:hypothetical protein